MTTTAGYSRREFLDLARAGAVGAALYGVTRTGLDFVSPAQVQAARAALGLSDPSLQPKFVELAPNALDPGFLFKDLSDRGRPMQKPNFRIRARQTMQETGLIHPRNGRRLRTSVWGYGDNTVSWPGQTIQVMSTDAGGADETLVRWENELPNQHLLPVDTNLHWAYSLHGDSSANGVDYRQYSIGRNGVPMVPHVHGGRTDFQYDGNPEFFFGRQGLVTGPQWDFVQGGFTDTFRYDNAVPAGNLWYHDHALGITRLNVYAGLAGFYFVRDEDDTGSADNPLGLPAFPYELAYAIQDRMFTDRGALFYSAFPGDPMYADFIETPLPEEQFPGGGPTALAEFFGDHMVVNGKIWPKTDVEPRNYRMHLLNGCDSRFLVVQFVAVDAGATDFTTAGEPIEFWVIGSDQGLGTPAQTDTLVIEPGGRYDVVVDFSGSLDGRRVIMKNIGGDAPFGGDIPGPTDFGETDRVMAFDVAVPLSAVADDFNPAILGGYVGVPETGATTRRVALFEGMDEFGRLQPLLGTVDDDGTTTAFTWFQETTEMPVVDTTEEWEIYNFTGDAHPVHLHLVNFEILGRNEITFDLDEANQQMVLQHNGKFGTVADVSNIEVGGPVNPGSGLYFESAPKDMVTALPGQVTKIRAKFDKPGRYVWHCHILSHEDHEMMRVLQVVESGPDV